MLTDTAAGHTDHLHSTLAEGISNLKLSETLQTSEQHGNNELLYFVDSLAWVPNIGLSLSTKLLSHNDKPANLHYNNTGDATTPEMPPIFKQKRKIY